MSSQEREKLAAPCGLYCGACSIYITRKRGDEAALNTMAKSISEARDSEISPEEDLTCNGCLSSQLAIFCRQCDIRTCAAEKGVPHCAQCSEFPCPTITNFNDDGLPHHSEVLANVRHQQETGIDAWLDEQEDKWRCPDCGCVIGWYDTRCPQCTTTLPKQFR